MVDSKENNTIDIEVKGLTEFSIMMTILQLHDCKDRNLGPVVQKVDTAIQKLNHYLADNC